MTASFDAAIYQLLLYEGGYSNDPDDPGGETKYGISKRYHPDVDILHLSVDEAKKIYLAEYWQPLRLDELREPLIAAEIFEQAVNFGPQGLGSAVENAQKALRFLGVNLAVDGRIGPKTLGALNTFRDSKLLFRVLNGKQFCRYMQIVEDDPAQAKYARGWLRRISL